MFKPDLRSASRQNKRRVQSNVEQIKKAIDIGQWVKGLVAELSCGMALFQQSFLTIFLRANMSH